MRVLLFLCACFPVLLWAEPMVSPLSNVQNIQQLQKILRDPTMMGGGFRKALEGITPSGIESPIEESDIDEDGELKFPNIVLVAKVFSKTQPAMAVFRVKDTMLHFEQGKQASIIISNEIVTLYAQEINQHRIKLLVQPFNKTLYF